MPVRAWGTALLVGWRYLSMLLCVCTQAVCAACTAIGSVARRLSQLGGRLGDEYTAAAS